MKTITSSKNPIYKQLKQLATDSKYRLLEGQTVLEGVHLCQAYLQADFSPRSIAVTEAALETKEVSQIVNHCLEVGSSVLLLSDNLHRAISGVKNGVGLVFVIDIPQSQPVARLETSSVLLDNIQDPTNLGAIARTAVAAGVKSLYCSPSTASAWSPKALRAGMGAHFNMDIYENVNLKQLIGESGIMVLATALGATASIYEKDLTSPTAWLFGNEGKGVSEELLSLNVEKVMIPQSSGVESLNVAAAAAVCLFEQRRQTSTE